MKPVMKCELVALVVFSLALSTTSFAGNDVLNSKPDLTDPKKTVLDEKDVSRFTDAISLINQFYVKPVNEKQLLDNAIKGIIAGLDAHSEYLDEKAYKATLLEQNANFGDIGLEVTSEYDVLKVISPIDDSPAAKAGIKSGDYIVATNDKLVSNLSLSEAISSIHGKKGTPLSLTVLRKGEDKPLKFSLIRDMIKTESVNAKMLDNDIGYIRVVDFDASAPGLIQNAVLNLQTQSKDKLKGLVIDLRNNAGGTLVNAVNVANKFLDSASLTKYKRIIVSTRGH